MEGAGRKSPSCVEISSLLRNMELFALEPVGWLFAGNCWFCAEWKVVCVLVASEKKKKERKIKEELVFLEACVVEMYLEEERELSFLLLSEGSRGMIQPQVAGEKSNTPQDLRSETLAMGGLRFDLPGQHRDCAGERVVVYSQARRFTPCTHLFPSQVAEVTCPAQENTKRTGGHR